jgi:hypothetical protein
MNVARPRRCWANGACGTTAVGRWATPVHRRSRSVVPPSGCLRSRVADARAVESENARLAWPPPCCTMRSEGDGRSGVGLAPASVWLKIWPGKDRLNGQRRVFRDIAEVVYSSNAANAVNWRSWCALAGKKFDVPNGIDLSPILFASQGFTQLGSRFFHEAVFLHASFDDARFQPIGTGGIDDQRI